MRILIILTPPLDPTTGGVQMSTVKMARMLSSQAYEVGVYSFEKYGHVKQPEVQLYPAPEAGNLGNHANLIGLVDALRAFAPDVVINQMPYEHSIGNVLKIYSPAALVGCLHNTLYSVRNNLDAYANKILPRPFGTMAQNVVGRAVLLQYHRSRHAKDLKRILATYDRFVMFAEPNLEELAYFIPRIPLDKIALIPHSAENIADSVPAKTNRILWLGRVNKFQKRADLIIPIWSKSYKLLPEWQFDVVGDGDLLNKLKSHASLIKLPRIQFYGRQPSNAYFERSSIFLMTSDFEAWGLTLTEAQAKGAVPVLFNSFPMAQYLVQDGHDGILIPKGNIEVMTDMLVKLCKNTERLRAMSETALTSVDRFSEEKVAAKWKKLIEEVSKFKRE